MKKFFTTLIMSLFLCVGCFATVDEIKAPDVNVLCKAEFINETASKLISISIVPEPLTEVNKQHHYKLIILYPKSYVEKGGEGEFKCTIHIPKGKYLFLYVIEEFKTHEVLGWKHFYVVVMADGKMTFRDIRIGKSIEKLAEENTII